MVNTNTDPNTDFTPYASITKQELHKIVIASCVGTLIEWYDFFVFGSMASTTASLFYKTGTPTGDIIAWLAANAVGFIFRPFGALVFGYIGDKVGRKYTFALTLVTMGVCTVLCGCLPTYDNIGPAAGVILIILRIIQGLAIGGEYGGAASYIAEHCPHKERGFWTSFLQSTATGGLILALAVILIFRVSLGEARWAQYGWRFPFLISIFMIAVSLYIRLKMKESPLFAEARLKGKVAKNPLVESFLRPYNLYGRKPFLLVGITAGAVFFYPMYMGLYYFRPYENNKATEAFRDEYSPAMLGFIVWMMIIFVTMAYGPIAAFLVELFPTSIRYTSMSLPYHIGNGIFGGLVPVLGVTVATATGNRYGGLFFPIVCAAITSIVCLVLVPETMGRDIENMEKAGANTLDKEEAESREALAAAPGHFVTSA
ncbi:hypothetical protein CcCBS67573_g09362 [Chytriomyces confervae]|uniref:Major facilitator superfamily (MFS) profile domain-containing protein n=1 Tax=Chytriomyces confervae TaxID=246404 RepID=A0A507DX92_9FUNG|nr:hypothetical protein CcCBS67573_g09362 [Chytriomyces confervae]